VKIVIYGLAKSGTSALFYKIRNSLPAGTIALFEPTSFGPSERLSARLRAARRGHVAPHVLAKVLPWDSRPVRLEDFERFERKVLLVRDPRDRLVSHLLYKSYNAAFIREEAAALEFLGLLRLKESAPASVPLLRLLETFERLEREAGSASCWRLKYHEEGVVRPLRFHGERPGLPVFTYEELVDGRFEGLESRLGLSLSGSATVPPALRRVERTKSYGAWRSWFTPQDVEALRPLLQPYLELYYPAADWDVRSPPSLDPEHGSNYVRRVMDEGRALWDLPPLASPAG
jgi:hypothetical protein